MTDSSLHDQTPNSTTPNYHYSAPPDALKALPRPISIRHSQSYEPSPPSPTGQSRVNELRGVRSSASLHLLSNSNFHFQQRNPQELGQKSQIQSQRTSPFSNPFKKLQNTIANVGKKGPELSNNNNATYSFGSNRSDRTNSPTSPTNSISSWKSKGAEILSKPWGKGRKRSELTMKNVPEPMYNGPIFGVDLEIAIRLSHVPETPMVPAVLYRCAEFLEARGVDEVGLYRVPGSHASVQKLKKMFDTGQDYNLLEMDGIDSNDIATLLKLYLRELPSPLMPPSLLEQFQSLLSTDRQICYTLSSILIRLPPHNYAALSFLCHHLSKIASHDNKTKMTVSNLGVVFAPTLAIGSVLFKALLGGFYEGSDAPEHREKGLEIVWGGIDQVSSNDIQDQSVKKAATMTYLEEVRYKEEYKEKILEKEEYSPDHDKEEYSNQEKDKEENNEVSQDKGDTYQHQQQESRPSSQNLDESSTNLQQVQQPTPPMSYKRATSPEIPSYQNSSHTQEERIVSTALSSMSFDEAAEESLLMKSMLEREEEATRPPTSMPPRSGSPRDPHAILTPEPLYSTTTATIPNVSSTMSVADNISYEAQKPIDPSLSPLTSAFSSSLYGSTSQVTIDAGTGPSTPFSTSTDVIARELSPRSSESSRFSVSSLKGTNAASQLQVLDPLSIS
ncbi:hypothetical protein BGZ76_002571 [Entomortierella beljakovae]|nr:hypothetical protein BGZ76_002571 [Entomortierella beljakovae]